MPRRRLGHGTGMGVILLLVVSCTFLATAVGTVVYGIWEQVQAVQL